MNLALDHSNEELKWYQKILMIATLPFVPAFFVYLGLVSYTENYLSERRVRIRMQKCGRYLPLADARSRIASEGGTLIIEYPTVSWDFTHAWWTPEDVGAKSPFRVPTREEYMNATLEMRCERWDFWCWKNYTSLDDGNAVLLRVWNGLRLEKKISAWNPALKVVHIHTGFAHMNEKLEGHTSFSSQT